MKFFKRDDCVDEGRNRMVSALMKEYSVSEEKAGQFYDKLYLGYPVGFCLADIVDECDDLNIAQKLWVKAEHDRDKLLYVWKKYRGE